MNSDIPRVRSTARALIVTQQHEALLLSVTLPWLSGPTWTMPGGGIEDGETAIDCARREIHEETGYLHETELIPCWHTTIEFQYRGTQHQTNEQYFLARVDQKFEPSMDSMLDYEKDFSLELRWWSLQEIMDQRAFCSPKQIPTLIELVRENRLPLESEFLSKPMPENYQPDN